MMHSASLHLHALRWILLGGVVLCVLLMAMRILSGGELTQLPLLLGSAMLLALGGSVAFDCIPQGGFEAWAVNIDQLLESTLPLFGELFVMAFLAVAFALMLKKLLE